MKQAPYLVVLTLAGLTLGLLQCGSDGSDSTFNDGQSLADAGGDASDPATLGGCIGCTTTEAGAKAAPICGDGFLADTESCDDGNTKSGDGCSDTCKLEPGFACPTPGLRCEAARCGDGVIAGDEECEGLAGVITEGCSDTCRILPTYDCDPVTKLCHVVVCGDAKVERGETCEDGNGLPFDGCFGCSKEPKCAAGVCQGECGDGQRFAGEECDDGNRRAGDGCSATCTVEKGYACTDVVGEPPLTIDLPVLIRDFVAQGHAIGGASSHPDFNQLTGDGVLGIVDDTLGVDGRPMYACPDPPACLMNPGHQYKGKPAERPNTSTRENIDQWFRNVPGTNIVDSLTVTLARNPVDGTYSWNSADAAANGGKTYFDPFGTNGWVGAAKETLASCGPDRNVSWTTETHFFFEYQGGERFEFSGDDDTWVFVNGKLAVDLGGLHAIKGGSFTLDADTDGAGADTADGSASITTDLKGTFSKALGLTLGGVYEVVMFQAERNECGSNFKVTLKDFNRPKSSCKSTCGDGVVASNEVCDDGKNDGSYGGCMPGCLAKATRCGDGKIDPGEQCDDGNADNADLCSSDCKTRRTR